MKNISPVSTILTLLTSGKLIISALIFFTIVVLAYVAKIPMAYLNFYAEDGILFFQDAKDLPFPIDLLVPAGGYFVLVSRIIGRLITFFPVEVLPLVNFIFICVAIAILCAVTWRNLSNFISNALLRLLCCLSLIFLPIINFELMASSSSLHFLLLFPATLILINFRNGESLSGIDTCVLVLALLSDPLSIIIGLVVLLRPLNLKIWESTSSINKRIYVIIFFCIALQGLCAAYTLSLGHRKISGSGSLLKTIYLYLDRVVGSSVIPNWGFVNSNDFISGMVTTTLLLRGSVALIIVIFVALLVFHLWRNSKNDAKVSRRPLHNLLLLLVASSFYWLFAGYLFNPEPRYAIFPGLCLIAVILMLFDVFIKAKGDQKSLIQRFRRSGIFFVSLLLVATWIFSITPSSLRTVGPTWNSELLAARSMCDKPGQEIVKLRILPSSVSWFVTMKCSEVNEKKSA